MHAVVDFVGYLQGDNENDLVYICMNQVIHGNDLSLPTYRSYKNCRKIFRVSPLNLPEDMQEYSRFSLFQFFV